MLSNTVAVPIKTGWEIIPSCIFKNITSVHLL